MISVEELIELAKEIESEDPIDWGMLAISEEEAYRLMALNIYEMYHNNTSVEIMMATILKLIVENFVLNLKLLQR